MFIYSIKASTLKFVAIVAVGIAVFVSLFVFIPPYEEEQGLEVASVSYENIKTDEQRRADYALIKRVSAANNAIVVYATAVPTASIPVSMEVIR